MNRPAAAPSHVLSRCGKGLRGGGGLLLLTGVLAGYGDVKPSMLQDLEHGRPTEIDFINGHVVDRGRRLGVAVPVNAAIVETVHALSRGALVPSPHLLGQVLRAAGGATSA